MRWATILLLAMGINLNAEILETKDIGDVVDHLSAKTLVVFDLDNTLMHPAQELGNDQWFRHCVKVYLSQGESLQNAIEQTVSKYLAILNLTRMQHVDPGAVEVIEEIQERGYHVMGLTARGISLARATTLQLGSLGFDLKLTSPTSEHIYFMHEQGILFREGVLFCSGVHKGTCLTKFLSLINMQPEKIVFVDDKASHVAEVEMECDRAGIEFVGLRYGYLDEAIENFSPEIVAKQWESFGKLISNERAQELIDANS